MYERREKGRKEEVRKENWKQARKQERKKKEKEISLYVKHKGWAFLKHEVATPTYMHVNLG